MIDRSTYVDKIMAYTDTPFVKVLTGVRRCGKSTILKMIMKKLQEERSIPENRIINIRFDSIEYEDTTAKEMYRIIKEKLVPDGKSYLFLDEVQEIKGWEKVVNSLATDYDVDLYVTGSNSRMMSSEIATYLTGRYKSLPQCQVMNSKKTSTIQRKTSFMVSAYFVFDSFSCDTFNLGCKKAGDLFGSPA